MISIKPKNIITIFTDGSSRGNGKREAVGGIGVFFNDNDRRNVSMETKIALVSAIPQYNLKNFKVTNNISELTAVLVALKSVKKDLENNTRIEIKSDSMYVINSLTLWYKNWIKNNFKNATGKTIANKEIIEELLTLFIIPYKPLIIFCFIPAHTVRPSKTSVRYDNWYGNFQADKLSTNFNSSIYT